MAVPNFSRVAAAGGVVPAAQRPSWLNDLLREASSPYLVAPDGIAQPPTVAFAPLVDS